MGLDGVTNGGGGKKGSGVSTTQKTSTQTKEPQPLVFIRPPATTEVHQSGFDPADPLSQRQHTVGDATSRQTPKAQQPVSKKKNSKRQPAHSHQGNPKPSIQEAQATDACTPVIESTTAAALLQQERSRPQTQAATAPKSAKQIQKEQQLAVLKNLKATAQWKQEKGYFTIGLAGIQTNFSGRDRERITKRLAFLYALQEAILTFGTPAALEKALGIRGAVQEGHYPKLQKLIKDARLEHTIGTFAQSYLRPTKVAELDANQRPTGCMKTVYGQASIADYLYVAAKAERGLFASLPGTDEYTIEQKLKSVQSEDQWQQINADLHRHYGKALGITDPDKDILGDIIIGVNEPWYWFGFGESEHSGKYTLTYLRALVYSTESKYVDGLENQLRKPGHSLPSAYQYAVQLAVADKPHKIMAVLDQITADEKTSIKEVELAFSDLALDGALKEAGIQKEHGFIAFDTHLTKALGEKFDLAHTLIKKGFKTQKEKAQYGALSLLAQMAASSGKGAVQSAKVLAEAPFALTIDDLRHAFTPQELAEHMPMGFSAFGLGQKNAFDLALNWFFKFVAKGSQTETIKSALRFEDVAKAKASGEAKIVTNERLPAKHEGQKLYESVIALEKKLLSVAPFTTPDAFSSAFNIMGQWNHIDVAQLHHYLGMYPKKQRRFEDLLGRLSGSWSQSLKHYIDSKSIFQQGTRNRAIPQPLWAIYHMNDKSAFTIKITVPSGQTQLVGLWDHLYTSEETPEGDVQATGLSAAALAFYANFRRWQEDEPLAYKAARKSAQQDPTEFNLSYAILEGVYFKDPKQVKTYSARKAELYNHQEQLRLDLESGNFGSLLAMHMDGDGAEGFVEPIHALIATYATGPASKVAQTAHEQVNSYAAKTKHFQNLLEQARATFGCGEEQWPQEEEFKDALEKDDALRAAYNGMLEAYWAIAPTMIALLSEQKEHKDNFVMLCSMSMILLACMVPGGGGVASLFLRALNAGRKADKIIKIGQGALTAISGATGGATGAAASHYLLGDDLTDKKTITDIVSYTIDGAIVGYATYLTAGFSAKNLPSAFQIVTSSVQQKALAGASMLPHTLMVEAWWQLLESDPDAALLQLGNNVALAAAIAGGIAFVGNISPHLSKYALRLCHQASQGIKVSAKALGEVLEALAKAGTEEAARIWNLLLRTARKYKSLAEDFFSAANRAKIVQSIEKWGKQVGLDLKPFTDRLTAAPDVTTFIKELEIWEGIQKGYQHIKKAYQAFEDIFGRQSGNAFSGPHALFFQGLDGLIKEARKLGSWLLSLPDTKAAKRVLKYINERIDDLTREYEALARKNTKNARQLKQELQAFKDAKATVDDFLKKSGPERQAVREAYKKQVGELVEKVKQQFKDFETLAVQGDSPQLRLKAAMLAKTLHDLNQTFPTYFFGLDRWGRRLHKNIKEIGELLKKYDEKIQRHTRLAFNDYETMYKDPSKQSLTPAYFSQLDALIEGLPKQRFFSFARRFDAPNTAPVSRQVLQTGVRWLKWWLTANGLLLIGGATAFYFVSGGSDGWLSVLWGGGGKSEEEKEQEAQDAIEKMGGDIEVEQDINEFKDDGDDDSSGWNVFNWIGSLLGGGDDDTSPTTDAEVKPETPQTNESQEKIDSETSPTEEVEGEKQGDPLFN